MFKRILEDNLQVPFTWETMLSKEGNNKNTWEKLIQSGKLGYMAALRNLRNIIKAEPDNINDIYDMIRNKERVIFSDNEINSGYDDVCQKFIDKYRKKINPDVYVHAVDLLGYGTQQFKGPKVNIIAGWSEKILEFISKVENGLDNMKLEIERYHFKNEESMVI